MLGLILAFLAYIFTVLAVFLAFIITRAIPKGHPVAFDIYRGRSWLTISVSDYYVNTYKKGKENQAEEEEEENNGWETDYGRWDEEVNWEAQPLAVEEPNRSSLAWVDWIFATINTDQISRIAARFFENRFRQNYERENGYPYPAYPTPATESPADSVPELETVADTWELNSQTEIPGF